MIATDGTHSVTEGDSLPANCSLDLHMDVQPNHGERGIRLPLKTSLFSPFSPPIATFGDVLSPPRLALAK